MEIWVYDLASGDSERLYESRRDGPGSGDLAWSPDGRYLAFKAAPTERLPEGGAVGHNSYDTDLFVMDLEEARLAVEAGRLAYESGRMPRRLYASASSPVDGVAAF